MNYATALFDCDGVILNSNGVKSEAFYRSALPFGEALADQFVEYHKRNGGVSRYRKFEYFVHTMLSRRGDYALVDNLLARYSELLEDGLATCEVDRYGLEMLDRLRPEGSSWCVVSGGDQQELRTLFEKHSIAEFFDAGIFGSPSTKVEIIDRLIVDHGLDEPLVMLGDSKLDYEVAEHFGMSFIFIYGWTEFADWRHFFVNKNVPCYRHLSEVDL